MKPINAPGNPTNTEGTGVLASIVDRLTTIDVSSLDRLVEIRQEQKRVDDYRTRAEERKADVSDVVYKRVIDGVADLGFPLSVHFEATYGVNTAAFETLAEMLAYWSPDKP